MLAISFIALLGLLLTSSYPFRVSRHVKADKNKNVCPPAMGGEANRGSPSPRSGEPSKSAEPVPRRLHRGAFWKWRLRTWVLASLPLAAVETLKPLCSPWIAGTTLLSGPCWTKASFGSPEGHSLRLGTSDRQCFVRPVTSFSGQMDALLRTVVVSRASCGWLAVPSSPCPSLLKRRFTSFSAFVCSDRKPPRVSTSRGPLLRSSERESASPSWASSPRQAADDSSAQTNSACVG